MIEDDFSYGEYNYDGFIDEGEKSNNYGKKKKIFIIIIVMLFLIVGFIATLILVKKYDDKDNSTLVLRFDIHELQLKIGETKQINAKLDVSDGLIIWETSNENVAIVENGLVKAIGEGSAMIEGIYIDSKGVMYKEQCIVEVKPKDENNNNNDTPPGSDKEKPTITYKVSSTVWTNKDVTISVTAKDNIGIKSLQYTTNCTNNCKYTNIASNTIKITQHGSTTVYIVATDTSGNSTTESVKVLIDKVAPTISLNITGPNVYNNTGSVEVCATCTDKESGCAKSKVCETYKESQTNKSLTIVDKVGNATNSYPYNIIIDQEKPTCSLKVSRDGTLTASYNDTGGSEILYYGFNENYTGENATTMVVNKDKYAANYKYYVKDNASNVNSCSIEVRRYCSLGGCSSGYEINGSQCCKQTESGNKTCYTRTCAGEPYYSEKK